MKVEGLQSFKLELLAKRDALLPKAMGHQGLALFLNLIKQFDPALSARLHDEPGYRPYTLSLLHGVDPRGESVLLHAGQSYGLRVTLLDGGSIWQRFQTHFLETHRRDVRLGEADLQLTRVVVTPATDSTGWVNTIEWSDLAALPPQETVTLSFITPTAFSLGERAFRLFPEPTWVWESALRDWNRYAPRRFQLEKSVVREGVERYIGIAKGGAIAIETLHFSGYIQKGFVGTCT